MLKYFEDFKHLRQALFALTIVLLVGATNFGQETSETTAAKEQKRRKRKQKKPTTKLLTKIYRR